MNASQLRRRGIITKVCVTRDCNINDCNTKFTLEFSIIHCISLLMQKVIEMLVANKRSKLHHIEVTMPLIRYYRILT